MRKEEKIKRLLCDILRKICNATYSTDFIKDVEFDATVYIPQFRYMPTFCFMEEDIEIIKDLSEEMSEDFSILTDK